ncbi:phage minor capsid protein [Peribacillus muralis]|uniref:phage minor capsid protein n=1 Tax=Peribacillus muralis TaxID=264697 RepID=UPI00367176CC
MYQEPAKPNYDNDINKLVSYYQKAYKEVLTLIVDMKNIDAADNIYQRQASVLRQIEVILTQLNTKNKAWCTEMVRQAFLDGQASALLTAGLATTLAEAVQDVQFSMLSRNTVDALINDTYKDLLKATNNTSEQVKKLVQQVTSEVLRVRAMQNYGLNTIRRDIARELTNKAVANRLEKDGFIGIVDKAGRRWSTKRYSDMIARTKLSQAHVQGVRVAGIERGKDLAVISTHNAPDECSGFEGMIISMNGLTEGLLSYQEIYNSNKCFHPNCQHKVHLINLDLFPAALKEKHSRKVAALPHKPLKARIKPLDKIKVPSKETVKNHSEQLEMLI